MNENPNHHFPRHSHDQFSIGVIAFGAQRPWSAVGQVAASAGDVIMADPRKMHVQAAVLVLEATSRHGLRPDRPMQCALGVLGFVVCTVGAVVTWNRGLALGPHWYLLALVATAVPCTWLGSQRRVTQFGQTDGRLQQR